MNGTDDETRWTIASTCWRDSERPFSICTNTDAVGGVEARAKTDFSGIARCTRAVTRPSISLIDLESSISWPCFSRALSTDLLDPMGFRPPPHIHPAPMRQTLRRQRHASQIIRNGTITSPVVGSSVTSTPVAQCINDTCLFCSSA